jgi:hypothetical protein
MASWEDVVSIGERLPGVEAGKWWGTPGLLVRAEGQAKGKGFCRAHVLVRLEAIDEGELATLIEDAWRLTAPPRLLIEFEESKSTN